MKTIDKSRVLEWESNPVTLKLKDLLREAIEVQKEKLAEGSVLHDPNLTVNYARSVGFIDGLKFVLEAELYSEPNEENIDDEFIRYPESKGP